MTTETNRIGIDESGKGDYFGPLVIAAAHVTSEIEPELRLMEVRDSKKISDGRILEIARDLFRRQETRELSPQRDYAVLRRSLAYAIADVTRAVGTA